MRTLNGEARLTGLFYLGLAISGLLGNLVIRPKLYSSGDAAATLSQLGTQQGLARIGVGVALLVVLSQTLAAVWFYRLFRDADRLAAAAITVFGLVNAVMILVASALTATAMQVAAEPVGDAANFVQLLYLVADNLWGVSALFFGLWLIPMGRCVLVSGWMPRVLGWILVAGGYVYVAAAFVRYLVPGGAGLADLLGLPATVGELWIVGYLVVLGVRSSAMTGASPDDRTSVAAAS